MVPGCHHDHHYLRTAASRGLGLAPQNIQEWSGSKDPTPTPHLAPGQPAGTARTGLGWAVWQGARAGARLEAEGQARRLPGCVSAGGGWRDWWRFGVNLRSPKPPLGLATHCSGKSLRPQKAPEPPCCCGWEAQKDEALKCRVRCGSGRAELGGAGAAPPPHQCWWQQDASGPPLSSSQPSRPHPCPNPVPWGSPEPGSQALRWLRQREF